MPVSPHLRRKLEDSLGADAAEDLIQMLVEMDPMRADTTALRADIAELRHEMQRGMEALRTEMQTSSLELRLHLEKSLRGQTRWMLALFVTLLVAVYFKG